MQDAVPHRGFYVIKLHDLKGSFAAVPAGRRNCGGSSFWILHNGGITDQRRLVNIKPSVRVHMSIEP